MVEKNEKHKENEGNVMGNKCYIKGFSLIEIILVLGVVSALIIAAFIVYPKVESSQRSHIEINNITSIQTGVRTLYSSSSDYKGLSTAVGVQLNIFPDNMLKVYSGTNKSIYPVNAFGGNVVLNATNDGKAFTIGYSGVSPTECTKIISAVASNFNIIEVNGLLLKDVGRYTQDSSLDISRITTYCQTSSYFSLTSL